jgi:polyhydroxyalkanoate synthesis regulator phasin
MAEVTSWKRLIEVGMQYTEMRRSQAQRIAADLVAQGHLARDQMASTVDELIELSRKRRDALAATVQSEVQRQLGALGLATKKDLERLERKLTGAKAPARRAASKAPAKKGTTKKSAAKKAAPRAAAVKKSAAAG